jgi:hypothetical protein
MRSIFLSLAFACLLSAPVMAGPRNQGYKPLSGDEIRTAFSDRTFAQPGKTAMRFAGDGKVEGSKEARAWSIVGDTLCLSGAEQTCFDVWQKGREIQMFAGENESEGTRTGVLQ